MGHRSVVLLRARSQRSQHSITGQNDDDEYIFDDIPFGMEVQEGNDQAEEAVGSEPKDGTLVSTVNYPEPSQYMA